MLILKIGESFGSPIFVQNSMWAFVWAKKYKANKKDDIYRSITSVFGVSEWQNYGIVDIYISNLCPFEVWRYF
jgi:hypothetical protein